MIIVDVDSGLGDRIESPKPSCSPLCYVMENLKSNMRKKICLFLDFDVKIATDRSPGV